MIDPHFWESAQDKGWTANECVVMAAAITASDDEGRGRISVIENNTKGIIPSGKLKKSLEILRESIIIYRKIYFFLPNFLEYNKPSHPVPSKIPKPSDSEIKSYLENTPDLFSNDSDTVKVSKGKDRLGKNSKGKGDAVDNSESNPSLLFKNNSSFTFTDYYPFVFANDQAIKDSLTKLSSVYCNGTGLTPSELTRLLNIITKTKNASRQTCFQLTAETFSEWKSFSPEKKNFKYFSARIEGKINDALTKAIEERAAKLKEDERKETEFLNQNEVKTIVDGLKNKFSIK